MSSIVEFSTEIWCMSISTVDFSMVRHARDFHAQSDKGEGTFYKIPNLSSQQAEYIRELHMDFANEFNY